MVRLVGLSDLHVVPACELQSGVLDTQDLLTKANDFLIERKEAVGSLDVVLVTCDMTAPIGFYEGPTGCATIYTATGRLWTMVPFNYGQGPYAF